LDTLGLIDYRKGIYRMAAEQLKRAVAKQPTARYQYHLGMSCLKAGDKELAKRTPQAALSQDSVCRTKKTGTHKQMVGFCRWNVELSARWGTGVHRLPNRGAAKAKFTKY